VWNFGGILSRNLRVYDGNKSTLCGDTAKISISQNMSEYPGPILTYFTHFAGILVGMIIKIFVWRSLKGRRYGNQLNLGDVRKRRVE